MTEESSLAIAQKSLVIVQKSLVIVKSSAVIVQKSLVIVESSAVIVQSSWVRATAEPSSPRCAFPSPAASELSPFAVAVAKAVVVAAGSASGAPRRLAPRGARRDSAWAGGPLAHA